MTRPPVVAVTLAAGALAGLDDLLRPHGVLVRRVPLFRAAPPRARGALDLALALLGAGGTLVVTSPRGAQAVLVRLGAAGAPGCRPDAVWAAGPATRRALRSRFPGAVVPAGAAAGAARSLAEAIVRAGSPAPVVHACGAARRPELAQRLRAAGLRVVEAVAYRMVPVPAASVRRGLRGADLLVVSSPRGVARVARLAAPGRGPAVVTVGPVTTRAARAAGLGVAGAAPQPDAAGVARAVLEALGAPAPAPG